MTWRRSAASVLTVRCLAVLLLFLVTSDAAAEPKAPEVSAARLMIQDGHAGEINGVAFSPNGKLVVTGGWDRTTRLWDVQTGKQLRIFRGHTQGVRIVCFSPDGKLVLTGSSDTTARLWDVQTGKQINSLQGHTAGVHNVAFSFDGKRVLTGSWDKTARLWDVQSGKQLQLYQGHTLGVLSVAFSPNDKHVLTGSGDGTARLWDVQTGKQLQLFQGHNLGVSTAIFSPDGKRVLTGSSDGTAILWDVQIGKLLYKLRYHFEGSVASAAFSPDGKLVLVGLDMRPILWDVETGTSVRSFLGHTAQVSSVCFSHDGKRLLTGSQDKTARLWDVQTGKLLHILEGHARVLSGTAFGPNDNVALIASRDGTASLWDVQTGKQLQSLQGLTAEVWSVAFSPNGKCVLTGSTDKTARLWDLQTGKQSHTLQGHTANVTSVAFSPDGKLVLTGSGDRTVRLWDVQTGQQRHSLQGHTDVVLGVVFSPNGKCALTGSEDQTARLWDVQTGKQINTLQGHTGAVWSVFFSPDGKLVLTGSQDKTARLWDVQTGKLLHTLQGHKGTVWSVAFSPDGKLVLTGSNDDKARLWDVQTGELLHSLQGQTGQNRSVCCFSPDGKLVLTGSFDRTACLWDVQTGKQIDTLQGHTNGVRSVCFSPDGKLVLTGSEDKTARLWDAQTAKELCSLISFSDGTWAVVDPQGRYDASNAGDVNGLHWVVGLEPIALKQMKERYYEPGLLAKHLGFNKEPLRQVAAFKDVKLFPDVAVADIKPADKKLTLDLTNRGGGIGRIQVFVNGKELLADARGPKPDSDAKKATLTVDLSAAHLIPGQANKVEVVTWNAEGYLSSRGLVREFDAPAEASTPAPELYAIVAGVSTYGNPALNLRFAAKDAEDFATALQIGGKRFFGADKVHLTLLTTAENAVRPTKDNLRNAFESAKKAKPGDVLVIYLAGHGVALQQGNDLYCYLTADARSLDPAALADPAVRAATTVSSEEMAEWIKQIQLKQVMVLDTCAAGAAAAKLTEKRDVSGDQIRAIERLKDRTGFHVLMGCAAGRVSYEASQYAQGLLTYALLQGMRGAALREEQFVDVSKLFQYAADQVPQLAQGIGGVQRPVVAAPRGSSFDVGRLETADKAEIPLALVKPLVLRPVLINRDEDEDSLKLTPLLRQCLHESSLSAGRGKAPPIVYVPEDEFPGAIRPTGTYGVVGKSVQVRLTLKKGDEVVARLMVEGTKDDLSGLAAKLTEAILAAAR